MTIRHTITIFLFTLISSCVVDTSDNNIYDPISIPDNLTGERLKDLGFEKLEVDSKTYYRKKDDFREIKYELHGEDLISRTYRIKYDDLDKFLKKYDGQIIATHNKDDIFKLKIRDKEVYAEVIRNMEGKFIEIYTDLFHIIVKD